MLGIEWASKSAFQPNVDISPYQLSSALAGCSLGLASFGVSLFYNQVNYLTKLKNMLVFDKQKYIP